MEAPFGNMLMCHMVADTHRELVAMADAIGVNRKWIQYPGTIREHFDIAKSKKVLAVRHGAIEITWRACGEREGRLRKDPSALARYFEHAGQIQR
jgi:hypothetical protein